MPLPAVIPALGALGGRELLKSLGILGATGAGASLIDSLADADITGYEEAIATPIPTSQLYLSKYLSDVIQGGLPEFFTTGELTKAHKLAQGIEVPGYGLGLYGTPGASTSRAGAVPALTPEQIVLTEKVKKNKKTYKNAKTKGKKAQASPDPPKFDKDKYEKFMKGVKKHAKKLKGGLGTKEGVGPWSRIAKTLLYPYSKTGYFPGGPQLPAYSLLGNLMYSIFGEEGKEEGPLKHFVYGPESEWDKQSGFAKFWENYLEAPYYLMGKGYEGIEYLFQPSKKEEEPEEGKITRKQYYEEKREEKKVKDKKGVSAGEYIELEDETIKGDFRVESREDSIQQNLSNDALLDF